MIYISPTGSFDNPSHAATNDGSVLIKVQIENSLELGWKLKDIILITNFDFQYGPVKATVIKDIEYFEPFPKASKINAIIKLFEKNLIIRGELYWFHDLDAFQLIPMEDSEIKLGKAFLGLSSYDIYNQPQNLEENKKNKKWNTGSVFFKKEAEEIFYRIKGIMYDHEPKEEIALTELTNNYENIRKRVKELDGTYNFVAPMAYLFGMTRKPLEPLRVIHYHPHGGHPETIQNITLIPERLEKIFKSHGIVQVTKFDNR